MKLPLAGAIVAINFLLLIAGCGSKDMESIVVEEVEGEGLITITKAQFESSQMKLGKMESTAFSKVINSNGLFDVPPAYRASVSVFFGGYVNEIFHLPGQRVKKGEVLMTMENPLYVQMQEEFLENKSKLVYLQSDLERQNTLLKENAVSQKQYAMALSEYEVVKAKFEGLRKKLRLIHINGDKLTAENITSSITITSPINGFITEVNASKGMYLQPTDPAFKILNNEHMHLELVIFEGDAMKIKDGQLVKFKVPGDDQKHNATVHLVGKTIDSDKRSVNIHCHLEEELTETFIPGMYVEATVLISGDTAMSLPQGAVVEVDGEFFALQLKSSDSTAFSFEKRLVIPGETKDGAVAIKNSADFKPGDQFLLKGAFTLIQE